MIEDPRITELWRVLALVHRTPRRQWRYRSMMTEHWQDLCEELFRDDIELYKQFIHELARRAFS
jgi:hypothetical protein